MDSLLPSYGCRTLNKLRKDNKYDLDPEFKEIFTTVLIELREKDIDVAELFEKNDFSIDIRTGRDRSSILNTVEGLIKILYPEVIDDKSQNIPKEVLEYFLSIAVLVRQTLNNQRAIKEEKEYTPIMDLCSSYRNAYFNYSTFSAFYTPHRIFIKHSNGTIEKQALDLIGIEYNKKEADILKKKGLNYKLNEISLEHSQDYNHQYLSNFQNTSTSQWISTQESISMVDICPQNNTWSPTYWAQNNTWMQPMNSSLLQNTGYSNTRQYVNPQVFKGSMMINYKEYNHLIGIEEKINENTKNILLSYSFHNLP